ncbi:endonuclease/exonuclease/phosphatase family protein [Pseudomonas sp. NPDC078416]|uniref:endonuclease/exonuclease/phosphatase family protein n=1 Tax=Pseudomonas sp. NPDC078416 TaxID=3390637 RepID=UPI003D089EB5
MARPTRYLLYLAVCAGLFVILLYDVTWHPARHEKVAVSCNAKDGKPPVLAPGQTLKVMTWNIQYLAGKRYVFWYDLPDGNGPDERPTPEDLAYNLDEVARVIRDEQPDIVLLQEVDDGAKNTDYGNQLALLQARVADLYPCSSEAFDWKSDFVPDRHIFGSVGRKLATLSRYQLDSAERLHLPSPSSHFISRLFQPQPALLVSYLPMSDGRGLTVTNTRLSDAEPGGDVRKRQVASVRQLQQTFEQNGTLWITGGDFNLLPQGQYQRLPAEQRVPFAVESELRDLWERFPMIPSNEDVTGEDRRKWYTRFPNDPRISGPDRTQDFLFHSPKLKRVEARVRQADTLLISDHMPVIARFRVPAHGE